MRVCYLASEITMPGSPKRRDDAFEHDQMMDALKRGFEPHGAVIEDAAWDDVSIDWVLYDAVIIGTAWDYPDRFEEFLSKLEEIASKTKLYNSPEVVRWNSHKVYLKDLADRGVNTIPTLWIDKVTEATAKDAFDQFGAEELIFKRQISANSDGQHKLGRGDKIPHMPEPMMVQPFLKSIQSEGEKSFIFIGGELSHAVQKRPVEGEYRIQSLYGGIEEAFEPEANDIAEAKAVLGKVDTPLLYARVDMLRGDDGHLKLMELEAVEPFLYPIQGPEVGARLYEALTT